MDNFNFESLNIFLTVSKFRSFSCAGNYLYLDPSTVSKKIRQLEKAVNRQLFTRTSHGVELTSAGVAFKKSAQKLLADLKELTASPIINWDALRIGILDNIAAYHYPDLIGRHLAQFKELKISVKGIELVHLFNDGRLDAIIINEEQHLAITGDFYETKLNKEPFGVIGSQAALPATVTLEDLEPSRLIIAPPLLPGQSAAPQPVRLGQGHQTGQLHQHRPGAGCPVLLPVNSAVADGTKASRKRPPLPRQQASWLPAADNQSLYSQSRRPKLSDQSAMTILHIPSG